MGETLKCQDRKAKGIQEKGNTDGVSPSSVYLGSDSIMSN